MDTSYNPPRIIDKVAYNKDLPNIQFAPIDANLKNKNRFYIGSAGRTPAPEMTIDDIRISKDISWANKGLALYKPSRHAIPKSPHSAYGSFIGKFGQIPPNTEKVMAKAMVQYPKGGKAKRVDFYLHPGYHVWLFFGLKPPYLDYQYELHFREKDADLQPIKHRSSSNCCSFQLFPQNSLF